MGIFNVSQRPVTELIHLNRFLGMVEPQSYIVRSHISGLITRPLGSQNPDSLIRMTLPVRGYDVLSAYPLTGFVSKSDGNEIDTTWIANLGLLGKMTGAAAIVKNEIGFDAKLGRISIDTSLKALDVLGMVLSSYDLSPVLSVPFTYNLHIPVPE